MGPIETTQSGLVPRVVLWSAPRCFALWHVVPLPLYDVQLLVWPQDPFHMRGTDLLGGEKYLCPP